MYIEVINANPSLTFHWPEGSEEYRPVIEVMVSSIHDLGSFKLYIAYGYRNTYGASRRRILVFRNEADVLAEFVGVNNWDQDKRVATFLRRTGSKRYLRTSDQIPPHYTSFNIVNSESIITGPYSPRCLAAIVDEADLSSIVAIALARERGEAAEAWQEPRQDAIHVRPEVEPSKITGQYQKTIVESLIAYRTQQKTGGPLTKNKDADLFLRSDPFAYLIAASIDRGARAETVWEIPLHLRNKLGHLDPKILSQMSVGQLENTLRSLNRQPRFPRQAAQTISSVSKLVANQFNGNTETIWQNRKPREVIKTFQQIWGVGPGIANMTIRILLDEFGYAPGPEGRKQINVKADIHVIRIFYRTGLITSKSADICIQAARQLHPEFPGLLDWPAWEIGRTWCHENSPDCQGCPLSAVCPRITT